MERITFRWGWVIVVLALAGLACTCGALNQANQTVQTAQVVATQAQASTARVKTVGAPTETSAALATPTSGEPGTPGTPQSTLGPAPKDIPIYKDNTDFFGADSAVMYSAAISYQDMLKFYKDQMPKNGWVEAPGSVESGGFAVFYYTKDNRKATVTVTDANGHASVVIAVEDK